MEINTLLDTLVKRHARMEVKSLEKTLGKTEKEALLKTFPARKKKS